MMAWNEDAVAVSASEEVMSPACGGTALLPAADAAARSTQAATSDDTRRHEWRREIRLGARAGRARARKRPGSR